ncbi:hypothetical protein LOK49_Contig5G00020 [Camellia lanceoleosa]|nr:hypothetical protein LOK49_Contig5G00020 [Camellia lanceoleosa]
MIGFQSTRSFFHEKCITLGSLLGLILTINVMITPGFIDNWIGNKTAGASIACKYQYSCVLVWMTTELACDYSPDQHRSFDGTSNSLEDNELRLVPGDELRLRYLGDAAHAARKYADATKWLSWAVILLEKTCDGAASMEVLSSRASCYKEVGEYKKAVVDCTKLTGRVEEKRRWPERIHQAIEAKEGVKIELAEAAKAQFSRDYSDNLALVRDYEAWKEVERDVAGYEYCWKNFLYAQSMKAIDAL